MKKVGFALLLAAAGILMTLTTLFGTMFWKELSSWLMIVVGLGAVGLVLIGIEAIQSTGGQANVSTKPTQPS